ncbi:hypothetical protein [Campylobacter phage CP81]|uniref:Uncharacterized protein n=3 Tax=Fletchervirus TaxID=1636618 RepID=G8GIZ8_9CAUD|nr:hypothetical protein CaPhCPX_gp086 [Campylobacter phage CPX]YP_009623300.1 hypothetical protein FDJ37_gp074 [Campylobacter phage CP81]AET34383.1 hypothetical protein [Campylobacter phage CPX]AGS81256.1 hypothetical protein [Campylobacter phage CP8]CBZ42241.1 hypothetical protein [Campylobacter phage CP81]
MIESKFIIKRKLNFKNMKFGYQLLDISGYSEFVEKPIYDHILEEFKKLDPTMKDIAILNKIRYIDRVRYDLLYDFTFILFYAKDKINETIKNGKDLDEFIFYDLHSDWLLKIINDIIDKENLLKHLPSILECMGNIIKSINDNFDLPNNSRFKWFQNAHNYVKLLLDGKIDYENYCINMDLVIESNMENALLFEKEVIEELNRY